MDVEDSSAEWSFDGSHEAGMDAVGFDGFESLSLQNKQTASDYTSSLNNEQQDTSVYNSAEDRTGSAAAQPIHDEISTTSKRILQEQQMMMRRRACEVINNDEAVEENDTVIDSSSDYYDCVDSFLDTAQISSPGGGVDSDTDSSDDDYDSCCGLDSDFDAGVGQEGRSSRLSIIFEENSFEISNFDSDDGDLDY